MFDTMQRVRELADERGLTLYQLSILSRISYNTLKLAERLMEVVVLPTPPF